MKTFLKWFGIIAGLIILLIIALVLGILISHDRFGFYPSSGPLSENQASYDVNYYELNLEVLPEDQALLGNVVVRIRGLRPVDKIELDLVDNFNVEKVVDGNNNQLHFEHDDDKLWVTPQSALQKGQLLSMTIFYSGQPVEAILPPWVGGFNWSKDADGRDWIGVSCQGEGGKIWFPCKDHTSDEPDSVGLNITVSDSLFCASNGLLEQTSLPAPGKKTYHWKTRYPVNNYNININIGNYETLSAEYVTLDGDTMPVNYYVLPQSREGAEEHLAMAVDMLYTYRGYYGEYPFTKEKFAIVETDYLGMEHQTINAYGNKYRYKSVNGNEYDWLMLHEMGHEWWGNKVTVNDLADMWIQEGICTYGEALYLEAKNDKQAYHNHLNKMIRKINNTTPIIPKKDATSHESYKGDIYYKGAWLMHSLRFLMGDEVFFNTLMEFATDSIYTYKNTVVTRDFIQLVEKNSDARWTPFIKSYLYTTELPSFQVDSLGENQYALSMTTGNYNLPIEIQIADRVKTLQLQKNPTKVESATKPVIDPMHWILKADDINK